MPAAQQRGSEATSEANAKSLHMGKPASRRSAGLPTLLTLRVLELEGWRARRKQAARQPNASSSTGGAGGRVAHVRTAEQ
mmetsp:Transcript_32054/g.88304  ORF Transcript_32054/g.88304 Transcript_32054/m.88304 type:complete len:80 (+) Transcript_32054:146-385(+)